MVGFLVVFIEGNKRESGVKLEFDSFFLFFICFYLFKIIINLMRKGQMFNWDFYFSLFNICPNLEGFSISNYSIFFFFFFF